MTLNDKLAKNTWVPSPHQHIIPASHPDFAAIAMLVTLCPAGRYRIDDQGSLCIDQTGCLECGACRMVCDEKTLIRWAYPSNGCGIQLRFG